MVQHSAVAAYLVAIKSFTRFFAAATLVRFSVKIVNVTSKVS